MKYFNEKLTLQEQNLLVSVFSDWVLKWEKIKKFTYENDFLIVHVYFKDSSFKPITDIKVYFKDFQTLTLAISKYDLISRLNKKLVVNYSSSNCTLEDNFEKALFERYKDIALLQKELVEIRDKNNIDYELFSNILFYINSVDSPFDSLEEYLKK